MADIGAIERKPTVEELRNYTPIGYDSIEKNFRKARIATEQEYVKKHEPFCARCADLDFKDMWEAKKKELERKIGKDKSLNETKLSFNYPDLEKYGLKERFDLKTKSPIIRDIVSDGVKIPRQVGEYYEYICKTRACGIAVEMPFTSTTGEPKKLDEKKIK